jgi:predicted nucleic acid-binding protein
MSAQALAEFFSVVTTKIPSPLSPADARTRLEEFVRNFTIYAVTPAIVLEAARGVEEHRMSFWDAQVWATAKLNQVGVVLSEDLQGWGFLEAVQFVNPLVETFDLSQ